MTSRSPTERLLHEYLGRVRSHLPVGSKDVVREIESSIRDRAEDSAAESGGTVDAAVMRRTLDAVGEPEVLAAGFVPRGHVVAPEHYRSFLVWTALAFAVHVALVGVATTMERALQFGPLAVSPVGPHGFLSLAAAALHALLMDVGLMVVAFAMVPRVRSFLVPRAARFAVDAAPRNAAMRAVLSVLVAAVLGVFRDRLFVVMDGPDAHPLFTPWFAVQIPLLLGLLGFAVVVDIVYVLAGERRITLGLDALHGAAALATMLHLSRGEPLLAVPAIESFRTFCVPVNGFLDDLGTLVLLFLAAVAAVKTVRRAVRWSQL